MKISDLLIEDELQQLDELKAGKYARVAGLLGALASQHGGKASDVASVGYKQQVPHALATLASYADPKKLSALPYALSSDELRRQQKYRKHIAAREDNRPMTNFTADDIKRLERITDLNKMKLVAKQLISQPSKRPMKPEKIAWFNKVIDSKNTPISLIKLMYDLLLGGEGSAVIGSRHSTDPNSYRKRFGEDDTSEPDHEASMAKSQLYNACKNAASLYQMIEDGDNLDGWVAAKITKAADYLNMVHDHLAHEEISEGKQRLDPKCWKGYRKQGTKMKGGVRVNNCVKVKK